MKINNNKKIKLRIIDNLLFNKSILLFCLMILLVNGCKANTQPDLLVNSQKNQTSTQNIIKSITDWVGEYELDTLDLIQKPKNSSSTVPAANYTLTISKAKNGEDLDCHFWASGVQLYDEFSCTVKENNKGLEVYFKKDESDKDTEFIPWKKGEHLFTLEVSNKKANKYLFTSKAYKILIPRVKVKSIYFTKSVTATSSSDTSYIPASTNSSNTIISSDSRAGIKVNGIGLGTGYKNALKILGKPDKTKFVREMGCNSEEMETEITVTYPGLTVKFLENADTKKITAYSFTLTNSKWQTSPKFKFGNSPAEVTKAYGKETLHKSEDGKERYLSYYDDETDESSSFYFRNNRLVRIEWSWEPC